MFQNQRMAWRSAITRYSIDKRHLHKTWIDREKAAIAEAFGPPSEGTRIELGPLQQDPETGSVWFHLTGAAGAAYDVAGMPPRESADVDTKMLFWASLEHVADLVWGSYQCSPEEGGALLDSISEFLDPLWWASLSV